MNDTSEFWYSTSIAKFRLIFLDTTKVSLGRYTENGDWIFGDLKHHAFDFIHNICQFIFITDAVAPGANKNQLITSFLRGKILTNFL